MCSLPLSAAFAMMLSKKAKELARGYEACAGRKQINRLFDGVHWAADAVP